MRFDIAALTDIGTKKRANQDCIYASRYMTCCGEAVFAVLCDGMGGLAHGELASSVIVSALIEWADRCLTKMAVEAMTDRSIREQWTGLIQRLNREIREYGFMNGFRLGSTATVMLAFSGRYFIMNIGDSRTYEIGGALRQITTDHTLAEDEVRRGNMTPEQAMESPIASVLTRCVGIEPSVSPDMFFGAVEPGSVYVLCSDGFRRRLGAEEIRNVFARFPGYDQEEMDGALRRTIGLIKSRGETDNISVIAITVH